MKCTDCRHCITEDEGYSNWTVEGTRISCLLDLNPSFPIDRGYGLPKELDFAQQCPYFIRGEPVSVDVDHEWGALENYSDDPFIKILLKNFSARY